MKFRLFSLILMLSLMGNSVACDNDDEPVFGPSIDARRNNIDKINDALQNE